MEIKLKRLLIVKIDHTGDYIIFRNFIEIIRKSTKFEHFHITILCNEHLKDLLTFLDGDYVDRILTLNLNKYLFNSWYTHRKEQELLSESYNVILQPTFSRLLKIDKLINKMVANEKISFESFDWDMILQDMEESKQYYQKLISIGNEKIFEFERYRLSFEHLINENISIEKPKIELKNDWHNNLPIDNYVVVYIGADAAFRKWDIRNYVAISKYLLDNKINVVLCGGDKEIDDAEEFERHIDDLRLYNLVGQTSLVDMLYLINNSLLLISNETNAPHIAVALDKKVLVISNGNHLGRFTPYPQHYTDKYHAIYPFDLNSCSLNLTNEMLYIKSEEDINKIKPSEVISLIKSIIKIDNFIKKDFDIKHELFMSNNMKTFYFALNYSYIFSQIEYLKNSGMKFIIYGAGTFGKTIECFLKEQVIGFVDKNSLKISNVTTKDIVYSPKNINNMKYDKIIISVLGREEEIINYLLTDIGIDLPEIVVFKIKY